MCLKHLSWLTKIQINNWISGWKCTTNSYSDIVAKMVAKNTRQIATASKISAFMPQISELLQAGRLLWNSFTFSPTSQWNALWSTQTKVYNQLKESYGRTQSVSETGIDPQHKAFIKPMGKVCSTGNTEHNHFLSYFCEILAEAFICVPVTSSLKKQVLLFYFKASILIAGLVDKIV